LAVAVDLKQRMQFQWQNFCSNINMLNLARLLPKTLWYIMTWSKINKCDTWYAEGWRIPQSTTVKEQTIQPVMT
jgi:hypothetical protein